MRALPRCAFALAALLAAAAALPARAQGPAAGDTTLTRFLGTLSDSTDRYFGMSAAPVDTAGLDTVIAESSRAPSRLQFGILPTFAFNRVDGSTPGVTAHVEDEGVEPGQNGWGRLGGSIGRAAGPGRVLGNAHYTNRLFVARQPFDLDLWAGRTTACVDPDVTPTFFTGLSALLSGEDWTHYLRNDGWKASLGHRRGWWEVRAGWRDLLQTPLETTAGWNLYHNALVVPWNLAAVRGRLREAEYFGTAHAPVLPLRAEVDYRTSSHRLGSDFEYRRMRVAAGLDLSLGRAASLVPQAAYGRLTGDPLPQASFYIGDDATMRSLPRDGRAGTGMLIVKVDLIGARDALTALHVPHPAWLPLRAGAFTATSATWGRDPNTGVVVRGIDLPDRRDFLSEVGASLVYDSAIFGPGNFIRWSYAWPIGPTDHEGRWTVTLTRVLDLLAPEPAPE